MADYFVLRRRRRFSMPFDFADFSAAFDAAIIYDFIFSPLYCR
jgi:hypothetical protein